MLEKVLCLFNKRFSVFNKDRLSCDCNKALIAYESLFNTDNLTHEAALFIRDKTGIDPYIVPTLKYFVSDIFKSPYYAELEIPDELVFTISPSSLFYYYTLVLGAENKGESKTIFTFYVADPEDSNRLLMTGQSIKNNIVSNYDIETGSSVLQGWDYGGKNYIRMLLDQSSYNQWMPNKVVFVDLFEAITDKPAFQNKFIVTNEIEPVLYTNPSSNSMMGIHVLKTNLSEYKFMVKKGDVWIDKSNEVEYDQWGFIGNWRYYGNENYSEWRIYDEVDGRTVKSGLLIELE